MATGLLTLASDTEYGGFYPWLFRLRGILYDALHAFVAADGYRLSDRIWRADAKTRNMIDKLLEYEIRNGTSAVDIAKKLEEFLEPERVAVKTRTPYGRWGSYDARRLARTEITAAAGRAVTASSAVNPFVDGIQWDLSPDREQDWPCNCRDNAEAELGLGPGVYPKGKVPRYPDHPHCMCVLKPIATQDTKVVVSGLRAWLKNEPGGAEYGRMMNMDAILQEVKAKW